MRQFTTIHCHGVGGALGAWHQTSFKLKTLVIHSITCWGFAIVGAVPILPAYLNFSGQAPPLFPPTDGLVHEGALMAIPNLQTRIKVEKKTIQNIDFWVDPAPVQMYYVIQIEYE